MAYLAFALYYFFIHYLVIYISFKNYFCFSKKKAMSLHGLKNRIMFYFLSTIISILNLSSVGLLLLKLGDVETNPGPTFCPTFFVGT